MPSYVCSVCSSTFRSPAEGFDAFLAHSRTGQCWEGPCCFDCSGKKWPAHLLGRKVIVRPLEQHLGAGGKPTPAIEVVDESEQDKWKAYLQKAEKL